MKVTLFGHPFAPIGMGEQLTSFSDALAKSYFPHKIFDLFGIAPIDDINGRHWLKPMITADANDCDVRIFHINGDEIEEALKQLELMGGKLDAAYNIIMPAWELSKYPDEWRPGIQKFDEVWAISEYVQSMFQDWFKGTCRHIGQACERAPGAIFSRKYFGLRDSAHVILGFFDESSYFTRKNPHALLKVFQEVENTLPFEDFQFVIKTKNFDKASSFVGPNHSKLKLISGNLTYDEITSLINVSDTFISLHRAEGLGRGGAEAILLGKNAVITGYSGVLDYASNPLVKSVDYDLVDCKEGDYPYCNGQQWAEPKLEHATKLISDLIVGTNVKDNMVRDFPNTITSIGVATEILKSLSIIENEVL